MARGRYETTQYFVYGAALATAEPLTMACWVYIVDLTISGTLLNISYGTGAGAVYTGFQLNNITSKLRAVKANSSTAQYSDHGTNLANNTWTHVGAVYVSGTSRFAYLNGSASPESTAAAAFTNTPNRTSIGARINHDGSITLSGSDCRIGEVAFWNIALTAADMLQLAAGYSPLFVKPESLVAYYPLIRGDASGDEPDLMGGLKMVEQGSVSVAAHPRVFYPGLPWRLGAPAAGGSSYQADTTYTKTLSVTDGAIGTFPRGASLSKTMTMAQAPGVQRYPAIMLARTMGFSTINIITKNAAMSLAKTLGITDSAIGIFTRSMSLAKSLTISQTPGVKRYPVVTLTKTLGFSDSATGVFPRGTSLAKTLSFSDVGGLQRQVTVTLSRNAGYATVNIITKNVAMSLARSMSISQTPGVKRYPVLTMTKTLTFSDIARGTFNHSVTLGKTLVIADVGSLKRLGVLTLARTMALSSVGNINTTKALTLALALQFATDGSTVIPIITAANNSEFVMFADRRDIVDISVNHETVELRNKRDYVKGR